jgi:K+-transporting ATPase ATPase C chain
MKTNILPAVRLTLVSVFVLLVLYPLLILGIAQLAPAKGEGEKVIVDNKTVGYKLEGQAFSSDQYFWSRPSAVSYNAAGSAGSNKGPSNPDYLAEVQARIDTFLIHHPALKKRRSLQSW